MNFLILGLYDLIVVLIKEPEKNRAIVTPTGALLESHCSAKSG